MKGASSTSSSNSSLLAEDDEGTAVAGWGDEAAAGSPAGSETGCPALPLLFSLRLPFVVLAFGAVQRLCLM